MSKQRSARPATCGNRRRNPAILRQVAMAARHLGELKGLCESLPDPQLLINTLVLQESKDSSAIENIVTTQELSDPMQ